MVFANFALRHARGLFVTLAVFVVLGLSSISSLPMSIYPRVGFARVVVVAQNGEMPPAQVQQNITKHLEQPLSTIPGAQLIQGNSAQGAAQISITFDPKIDVNTDLQRVNAVLAQHREDLAPGTVTEAQIVNPNIFPVLGYTVIVPGKSLAETRTLAEYSIKPTLTGVKGVAQVRTVGGRQKEYWVSVDPRQAASLKLSLDKLIDAIAKSNQVTSVGHYNAFAQRQIVLVSGAPISTSDVSGIVVDTRNGVPITVGDVATVHEALEPKTSLVSAQGKDAVILNVYAQPGGNVVQVYHDVDAVLQKAAAALGAGTLIKPYWNQAILVEDAVKNLRDAILIGAILSILVMWFFLGSIRSTLVAASVIPLTMAIAFFFMKLFDQGLNLMTLGALAIGVGLVIVDAIFVVENIWRHLQEGEDRVTAVRKAMAEIAVPMIGSTITTIVVFAPMALLSGVTGAFFIALSITLTIALALSLFFALYITPLLSAYILRPAPAGVPSKRLLGQRTMNWLLSKYEPALVWIIRRRNVAYAISGAIMLFTFLVARSLGTDFMPEMDEGAFEFNFTMPAGTSLEETDRALKQVETTIAANPNVLSYGRLTGLDPSGFFPAPPNAGNVRATLLERDKRKDSIDTVFDDIRRKVSERVPILKFTITQILQDLLNDLSNAPSTIEIKILGGDQATLMKLADQVDDRMKKVSGVVDDFNGIVYSNPNTLVRLRPLAGSRAGFSTDSFTTAVQGGLNGAIATTLPTLPAPMPVRVRYNVPWNQGLGDLETMPLVAPNGSSYSLGALADVRSLGFTTELNEENLQQVVRVTANVSDRDLGSTIADIQKALTDVQLPPGYRITYGGRFALQQQSFKEFGTAIGIAILLVFVTMVFEFRNFRIPLVIISSVPLSLFGVAIALKVTHIPLNVSSFMGLILLVGGVVKNGILLFDEVEKLRHEGLSIEEQMLAAGRRRMRPIIMTTLTSLLGVVPLAVGLGAGSEMQKPLAVATIGGLVFSTFFTLLLMPAFYASIRAGSHFDLEDGPHAPTSPATPRLEVAR
ncbi:MAG: efflux RND transporter permease subunit [Candidatus Eremiobacteraeota bacterium]|nr:efflux RND transporter permease subunit [Candidatus Eremiobacteraeota bacterium]